MVNSVASSVCSRHDPDVLRHEVAASKRHVEQLRREMSNMESEMANTQHGLRALSLYDTFTLHHHHHHHMHTGLMAIFQGPVLQNILG